MLLTQKSEKSSVSSQFSVLSSQFSVLSSQFSVLSSLGGEYTDNKYTIENLKRHRFLLLIAEICAFFVLNNFFYKEG